MINIFAAQSGTAVLKLISFITLYIFLSKYKLTKKILSLFLSFLFVGIVIYLKPGYIAAITKIAINVFNNPDLFFSNHTFYDRFYPIWPAIKSFFSFDGFFGLGFGGDYFEFKNLFPSSTHFQMITSKPTLSYFNTFASKIIIYFGIFGVAWLALQFHKAARSKNSLIKIACLNVLISSLWGVSSFALPYIWFWLALVDTDSDGLDHQSQLA
jgi:hypothetical protein